MNRLFNLNVDFSHRIFGLDVVRSIAVLLVVLGHSDRMLGQHWDYHPVLKTVFHTVFIFYLDGVDVFFVLSGLLIGSILIKSINQSNTFGINDLTYFWKRRWYRTLPNYYLILCLNVVVWYFIQKQNGHFSITELQNAQVPAYFLFLQNFNQACPPFFVESWSLAIEEWFYLLLPIVIFLLSKLSSLSKKQIILAALAVFLISSTGLRMYKMLTVESSLSPFDAGNLYRTSVLTRLDALMFGVLGAYIRHYHLSFWRNNRWVGFAVGVIMVYLLRWSSPAEHDLLSKPQLLIEGLHPTLLGIAILFMMPFADSFKQGKNNLFIKIVTWISLISYSLYLVNLLIIKVIQHFVRPLYEATASIELVEYVAFWVASLAISTLLYKFVEKPLMDLRK